MSKINCIHYIRVSTDEQRDKGYSPQHQEDMLSRYSALKNFNVVATFIEDHSAKTFDRPEFHKILNLIKTKKHSVDLLLFTKWDRFSRNAGDAYGMINTLNRMGVEPQAIEQPLDLTVPENKMMLAFYLAAPEVENDRRSLNVIDGMRRAKKDGRYVGSAPKGYTNSRDEQNRAIIIPNKEGEYIKKAFEWLETGLHNISQTRIMLQREFNFNLSKSNYHRMIRNPLYAGLVPVSARKGEAEQLYKGIHEPLISEDTFWNVQDILNQRVRNFPTKQNKIREEFPLRSHLKCSKCGGVLTGSRSKGRNFLYNYYHCQYGCKERIKAELVNDEMERMLNSFDYKKTAVSSYQKTLNFEIAELEKSKRNSILIIDREIAQCEERIKNALQYMLDAELAPDEYRKVKLTYDKKINDLTRKKVKASISSSELLDQVNFVFGILQNLGSYYKSAPLPAKKHLIDSIFKEKLIFEENQYRTPIYNEVMNLILNGNKGLDGNKKGTKNPDDPLSRKVLLTGLELLISHRYNLHY